MPNEAVSRRTFLETAALAPVFPAILRRQPPRRNVLFIATDDCCNRLGCYGHPIVKTPNLDRLARSSVRFDRAYCQYAWCSPSRSSLMTGLAPDTTRVWDLTTHFRQALPDVVTLPQAFLQNGYFTARVGKIYHYSDPGGIGTSGLDDPRSWNATYNPAGVDHTREEPFVTIFTPDRGGRGARGGGGAGRAGAGGGARSAGAAPGGRRDADVTGGGNPVPADVPGDRQLGGTLAGYKSPSRPELHTDYLVADAVIALMERHRLQRDVPWFLGAGFYKPHVPWIVPQQYYDLYPLDRIEPTPFDERELSIAPHWAYTSAIGNGGMSVQQQKEALQGYYAAASFLDANVGRVLDAMERLGYAANTTVVFWSDHGYHLGEHGQWQKNTVFEVAARVPLMIGGAGVEARGGACPRTVEHLDLYPTLVDLCGLQGAPPNLHGQSLAPLLANPTANWNRPAVSQMARGGVQNMAAMGYSLRTERYRYTFWNEGREGEELYDYDSDPRELRNLASESGSSALKARLRATLERICRERGIANTPLAH
jgi:uncharacterized sulfatase